jgi:type II secretory pathway pseudopilin PulG
MRVMDLPGTCGLKARAAAFTLAEVVICVGIMMFVFAAIITSYIQTSYRAEWSGFSLAAQSSAVQQLEAAKSAVWDPLQSPAMDQISQLPRVTTTLLDLPVVTTNIIYATNYTTVTMVTTSGGYNIYFVKVDTAWPFRWKNQVTYFTNTVADYFAPD